MSLDPTVYDNKRSRATILLILAVCLLFAGVWAYVFVKQKPRVADGAIESVVGIPVHTEMRTGTLAQGVGGAAVKDDETLVWVRFSMKNLTADVPLYATQQRATLMLADGEQLFAYAQSPREIAEARTSLPQLKAAQGELVPRETTLLAGKETSGYALFAFPVSEDTWSKRHVFSLEVTYQWQRPLELKEPHPPIADMMPTIGNTGK